MIKTLGLIIQGPIPAPDDCGGGKLGKLGKLRRQREELNLKVPPQNRQEGLRQLLFILHSRAVYLMDLPPSFGLMVTYSHTWTITFITGQVVG